VSVVLTHQVYSANSIHLHVRCALSHWGKICVFYFVTFDYDYLFPSLFKSIWA